MNRAAGKTSRRIPSRIVYWIIAPVLGVGILFVLLVINYTTPSLTRQITDQIDSNLKLASELGLEACEERFNYLIELRLENDVAMNTALKHEAVEAIKGISKNFQNIHTLVLEAGQTVVGSSQALPPDPLAKFDLPLRAESVIDFRLWDRPVRMHYRFFPFWDWQVIPRPTC